MSSARVKLKLNTFISVMLLYAAFLIVPVQAFWRHLCFGELGTGRIDPIMTPGTPSLHAHVLFGASSQYPPNPLLALLLLTICRHGTRREH